MSQYFLSQMLASNTNQTWENEGRSIPEGTLFSVCYGQYVFEADNLEAANIIVKGIIDNGESSELLPYIPYDVIKLIKTLWDESDVRPVLAWGKCSDLDATPLNDQERKEVLKNDKKFFIVFTLENLINQTIIKHDNLPNVDQAKAQVPYVMNSLYDDGFLGENMDAEVPVSKVKKLYFWLKERLSPAIPKLKEV